MDLRCIIDAPEHRWKTILGRVKFLDDTVDASEVRRENHLGCIKPQTTIYTWLFQLDDSKSWYRKWLFHQTSIYKLLFGVPGAKKPCKQWDQLQLHINCCRILVYNVIGYTYYILWLIMIMQSGLTNPEPFSASTFGICPSKKVKKLMSS